MEDNKPRKRSFLSKRYTALLAGFCLWFACLCTTYGQVRVTGLVTDGSTREPLAGVTVQVVGTKQGAITDMDGRYAVEVPTPDGVLNFSFIGFRSQKIRLNGRQVLNVQMTEDNALLSEVVVVGYGTQKRASITGAVSSIKSDELMKAPQVGLSNVLAGRVSGVTMLQRSGRPGGDDAHLLVRGEGAKVIVDGIERSFNEIDPNEIASISILKDATSASIYGLNASAVILVTTKKGKEGKLNISYNGSYGISQNANKIAWLDGPSYAKYHNLATELDGGTPIFSEKMIYKMRKGLDGWGNTDWYGKVFGLGQNMTHNINASGGTDKIQYFASLGVFDQKGNVEGFNYNRYNLRSNVTSQITDRLSLQLNIAGRLDQHSAPKYSANPGDKLNIPKQAVWAVPYLPMRMTDPTDGQEYYVSTPTASTPVSPFASIRDSGYTTSRIASFQSNFMLKYELPWIEGLAVKFSGAYDRYFGFNKSLQTPVKTLLATIPKPGAEAIKYTPHLDASGNTTLSESGSESVRFITQTEINYRQSFGKHHVTALGLLETRDNTNHWLANSGTGLDFPELDELNKVTNTTGKGEKAEPYIGGTSGHQRMMGLVARVNYDYDNRYLLELSLRRDGSYLFANSGKTRWINLPAVSAGWRIDRESWFDCPAINLLKLRGGIGKIATSNVRAFSYLNLMNLSPKSVVIGDTPKSSMRAGTLGNPNLSWAKTITYNAGVELNAWDGLLGLELDLFYKYQYDLIGSVNGAYPPSMGGYMHELANLNKVDYRGMDFTLSHNNKVGDFRYGVKLIGTLALRRWLYYAGEPDNTPAYKRITGSEVGARLGFTSLGLFQNPREIAHSATIPGKAVLPGYIKYKDLNGDGKITTQQDRSFVAKPEYPRFQGSVNLYAEWRGLDFDLLLLGAFGRSVALAGMADGGALPDNYLGYHTSYTQPFSHGGNSPRFLVENSWTPENRNADFPRLTVTPISTNNAYASDYWYRNGDYVRIKSCQIGYAIPTDLTNLLGIKKLRIYLDGSNLFTFSQLMKYNIDPEQPAVNNGYYPQQRTISLGLNLSL